MTNFFFFNPYNALDICDGVNPVDFEISIGIKNFPSSVFKTVYLTGETLMKPIKFHFSVVMSLFIIFYFIFT